MGVGGVFFRFSYFCHIPRPAHFSTPSLHESMKNKHFHHDSTHSIKHFMALSENRRGMEKNGEGTGMHMGRSL